MSTYCTFQTELVAIMEVLTKAAVTEIGKLVDDGYAVLRLEISRSHRENEELKRQLTLAIQTEPNRRTPQGSFCNINTGDCGVHLYRDKLKTTKEGDFPKAEGVFGELLPGQREDGECTTSDNRRNCDAKSLNTGDGRVKSQHIKVEWLEDDVESSNPPQGLNICGKKALESDGGERAPIVDTPNEPAIGTEQHSITQNLWEDDTLGTVLKAEPEHESVNLQDTRSEHTAGRLNSRGHEYTVYDGPVQTEQRLPSSWQAELHGTVEVQVALISNSQNTRAREGSVDTRSDGVQVYDEITPTGTSSEDSVTFPTQDSLVGKQSSFSLWRDGETTSVNEDQSVRRDEDLWSLMVMKGLPLWTHRLLQQ
ncbi:hypothetical protein SKAU_G00385210 [Synaphobranchus kaupii]|uniref:Uncharacterized protein n=1 Tax=Synaphobranchus kaupii TaxID=118154 RepID=A0A9Q1EEL1_SYNKA|nr:hypothetical protein SKAU_G00385210 [Synaphobranchus kaupii]